jgi:hypothetical protein
MILSSKRAKNHSEKIGQIGDETWHCCGDYTDVEAVYCVPRLFIHRLVAMSALCLSWLGRI